jgi:hypothetical protein
VSEVHEVYWKTVAGGLLEAFGDALETVNEQQERLDRQAAYIDSLVTRLGAAERRAKAAEPILDAWNHRV